MVFKILNFRGDDFKIYYQGANELSKGSNLYLKHLHSPKEDKTLTNEFIYPPFFAFMLLPFSMFSINNAKLIWDFTNLIFFNI